mmetsp:Transcript_19589/g.54438  ORF Transcript_19589/g.54438 Transcript_19589/m.54438 type:complete len:192 (-) Transcript_19589:400-975(-)|eukprot:CAMPEP_0198116540 /NCGR_PEP_ID=MMETSP1442-20131203/13162_1 /TAXON_ID= /ORGANISM="Craspedostauros australis, Strain CCMP3328" /LENGTH=191 /DNA_ID=CAMNT_0043774395 /DNA_START=117 /DNA_END=692 /DNA_ORIENTATION=-
MAGGKGAPKTVLDKVIHAIRSSPPGANGGVSRVSIAKYLKSEFEYDNAARLKQAIKKGVSAGKLVQHGQSFSVKGDASRKKAEDPEPLQMDDLKVGKGDGAEVGDTVTVKYAGKLDDGTQFDAANSFSFTLGAGDVIKGWDQGIKGMAVGGKRKLVVPSKLGYGKRGCSPDIPPNATLHFQVTMKKIQKED